jgi:hypothetical protein
MHARDGLLTLVDGGHAWRRHRDAHRDHPHGRETNHVIRMTFPPFVFVGAIEAHRASRQIDR